MRILLAPDKFKGSLTASQAAESMAAAIASVLPSAVIDRCPLADGGEGTVEAIIQATGGTIRHFEVSGPIPGTRVSAPIGLLPDNTTAIVELASASGLQLVPHAQRDPTRTTTFGTGELLRHATEIGARKIILAIGGSATCDAGLGIAQAWGAAIRMKNGKTYSMADRKLTGGDLDKVISVARFGPSRSGRTSATPPLLDTRDVQFVVACDVGNPLYGPDGAAYVFGPQKGATPEQVADLDAGLRKLADRLDLQPVARTPGAGAAGGVGFGMQAFFGAEMVNGSDLVLDTLRLKERLVDCDLCITGEGRFDSQSLSGKAPIAVARFCRDAGVPCIVVAGSLGEGWQAAHAEGVTAAFATADRESALVDLCERAEMLLTSTTAQVLRIIATPWRR